MESNFERDVNEWNFIYIGKDNPTPMEIMEEVARYNCIEFSKVRVFNAPEFNCQDTVKNDENLFYFYNGCIVSDVWQLGPKLSDMCGQIVPNTYKVRKIGYCNLAR